MPDKQLESPTYKIPFVKKKTLLPLTNELGKNSVKYEEIFRSNIWRGTYKERSHCMTVVRYQMSVLIVNFYLPGMKTKFNIVALSSILPHNVLPRFRPKLQSLLIIIIVPS